MDTPPLSCAEADTYLKAARVVKVTKVAPLRAPSSSIFISGHGQQDIALVYAEFLGLDETILGSLVINRSKDSTSVAKPLALSKRLSFHEC